MEEKKETKIVEMNAENVANDAENSQEPKKLSYEQLNNLCIELYKQNQNLTAQVQQINQSLMFKRMDYLFAVLQHADKFSNKDFVAKCSEEIQNGLTIPESKESETVSEESKE